MNIIEVSIEFYFKGRRHNPSAVINLDECMHHQDLITHIYYTIASENGIGSHTYELDVMVMEPLHFDHAHGDVASFIHDHQFDIEGFRKMWMETNMVKILQPIARKHLGIDNLDEHPALKAALIETYQAK